MTYPVKYYSSAHTGATQLSGTSGSLVGLLDSLLITGFNVKAVNSASRTGNTITLTTNVGHGVGTGGIVALSGANESAYNAEWKVTNINTTQLSFEVPADYPPTITGTMSIKFPPCGNGYWTKPASGTNKAIYRTTDPTGTQHCLRVDDSDARYAWCIQLEGFTTIDTGLLNNTAGTSWIKSNVADSSTRPWYFIGDSKRFYLIVCWSNYNNNYYLNNRFGELYFFGDIISLKPGDAYHSLLGGSGDVNVSLQYSHYINYKNALNKTNGNADGLYLMRSHSQLGNQTWACQWSLMRGVIGYDGWQYPNVADNGILMDIVYLFETNSTVRGFMPGIYCPLQAIRWGLGAADRSVKYPPQMPDREFIWMRLGHTDTDEPGGAFFDLTGPWE